MILPLLQTKLYIPSVRPNLREAFILVLLIAVVLLATSCAGSATQPSMEPGITPTTSQPDTVLETISPAPQFSPGQHLRFERISLEQGLSQSTVFCMLQDSQGYMWFGTEDGLNKYDGYIFTVYKHDPEDSNSLSGNRIQTILEDDSGTLWIGTSDDGLDRYDRKLDQFTHYRNDPDDPSSLSDDDITAIYQDQDGVLWIGTGGGGLDKFDQENERFVHYQHNPDDPNSSSSNAVSAIYKDRDGVLWVGTEDGGLNGLDSENERWRRYVNDPGDPHSLSHNTITAISEDQSGVLWVGTGGGGLERFDQENERFIHYQHDPDDPESLSSNDVAVVFLDRDGFHWIGTRDAGINWFDPEQETFAQTQNVPGAPHSLSSNLVLSIFQDREGGLWFGTIGGGVNKLNMGWRNFALYQNDPNNPNSLRDNMIRAFYQDQEGALWIGTMFGGVDRFDRQTGTWRHYRHDPNDPGSLSADWVSAIYRDRSDELWIGTASGLDRFNPETETFAHYLPDPDGPPGSPGNNVRTINQGQEGEFWIGTKGGLYRFDSEEKSWDAPYRHDPGDPDSLGDDWVFTSIKDREGRIWIGTFGGGLNRFDPAEETFARYQNDPGDPHSLSNNLVSSIVQDQQGTFWIGSPGGLDRFDPATATFTRYREKDGMLDNNAYCIVQDTQRRLWVSTGKGLSRFDPQSETFENYDVTDGLQSNEFNSNACLVSDSGEMFFGGIDGFNTFFPDRVQDNPTIPPVVLTSLVHGGEEVNLGIAVESVAEITLEWPDNSFEFEFAALSFAHPEKNQYAYYLKGFEETWNEVGTRRYGQYTNLPGGTYTLRVKGSNNDGLWNKAGTAIKIAVVPPFWATWWFRGVIFLAVLGVIFGGYRLRVRSLEARGRELESQVKQRTAELMKTQEALRQSELERAITEERSRLARELHDSVTQSLHSSTLLAEAGQRLVSSGDVERARGYLIRLGEISQQALKEMRLLVYELRPLALSGVGLVGALQQRLDAVERRSGVEVELSIVEELELPARIEEELFRIAMEALNNALKHANPTTVTVALHKEMKREMPCIELSIIDDGQGFDPDTKDGEGGLGLVSMQERIEKLGGELTILSVPGEGTQVKACVDLKPSQDSSTDQEV